MHGLQVRGRPEKGVAEASGIRERRRRALDRSETKMAGKPAVSSLTGGDELAPDYVGVSNGSSCNVKKLSEKK